MKPTWLVQRLQEPLPGSERNPFNWGCGLVNGGFSKEAYFALNQIFRFDYMGAAEFEFGAVPRAMAAIVYGFLKKNSNMISGTFEIAGAPIYYICALSEEKETIERIREIYKGNVRIKENSMFSDAIEARHMEKIPEGDRRFYRYAEDLVGWLELDNGFVFFIDKKAFDGFIEFKDRCVSEAHPTEVGK